MSHKIPEHFCIIPFVHLSCKSTGDIRVCCKAPRSYIIKNNERVNLNDDISDIWNSEQIKDIRKQFIQGRKPEICKICWEEEENNKISKRQQELKKFSKKINVPDLIEYCKNKNYECKPPIYIDLRIGNKCNLKCRMCNAIFSSSINNEVQEWKDSFFYKPYNLEGNISHWYTESKFLNNMKILMSNLKYMYITGGEPTIIPEVVTLLQKCIKNDTAQNIELRINTNLSVYNEDFYKLLKHFKKVLINPSIDAVDERLTYLRHPLKYKTFEDNLKKILKLQKMYKNICIELNCAVSIYNILYLDELEEKINKIDTDINIKYDIVHEPEFLNFTILPLRLKDIISKKLSDLIKVNNSKDIDVLIKMLFSKQTDTKKLEDFRIFTLYLDRLRKENFVEVFPELKELIDEL